MSNLKARLDTLRAQTGQTGPAAPAAESVSRRVERLRCGVPKQQTNSVRRGPDPHALAAAVDGELNDHGYVRIERFLPWGSCFGNGVLTPPSSQWRHLPRAPSAGMGGWLFVDTETSGLAGGTGTIPFLCGVAWFEDDGLRLRQYLLARFGAEPALLQELAARIGGRSATLVSYNGKSFDVPLLRDRFRLQGVAASVLGGAHVDLLHPVRRAFGTRWPDCRLPTLERELLGHVRVDDLPGAEVPDVWFEYLHRGATQRMAAVVRHNQDDLISLAIALPLVDRVYGEPRAFGADVRRVAAAHAEAGDEQRALALLEAASGSLCAGGCLDLAEHLRRRGEWRRACAIWEMQAGRGCSHSLERLAKYHEHVRRDWQRALVFAERLPAGVGRTKRVERLRAKLRTVSVQTPP